MKRLLVSALLLSSTFAHAGMKREVSTLDCEVQKVEDARSASGLVEVGSRVAVALVYEGNEFIGYKAEIGTTKFAILSGRSSSSALTNDSIKRESVGYGESYTIIDSDNLRKFVIITHNTEPLTDSSAELFIGGADESAVALTATLECK